CSVRRTRPAGAPVSWRVGGGFPAAGGPPAVLGRWSRPGGGWGAAFGAGTAPRPPRGGGGPRPPPSGSGARPGPAPRLRGGLPPPPSSSDTMWSYSKSCGDRPVSPYAAMLASFSRLVTDSGGRIVFV